jgi:hypothetical protein
VTGRRKRHRVEKVQIYLCKDVAREKVALDVWRICSEYDRPQDVFRDILFHGIRHMVDEGLIPEIVLRKAPEVARMASPHRQQPAPQPGVPAASVPPRAPEREEPPRRQEPAKEPAKEPEAAPPVAALLSLMRGAKRD